MPHTILLYGATGYSGELIVAEAVRQWQGNPNLRLVLAGRDRRRVASLAGRHGMDFRAFALDDHDAVIRGLAGVSVILNAAGPFCLTAQILAKAALTRRCHYVDINDEFDVYKRLDDLRRFADLRDVVMVCAAAYWAAASDLLLDEALASPTLAAKELGTIRIAFSRTENLSSGSLASALRLRRQQVVTLRDFGTGPTGRRSLGLWHVPVGTLERSFAIGPPPGTDRREPRTRERIAAAVNLVDTLVAAHTVERRKKEVRGIEVYRETSAIGRVAVPLGGVVAPFLTLPGIREFARLPIRMLPEGPTGPERRADPARLILTIEDATGSPVLSWRLDTPNAYLFTARIALAVARALVEPDAAAPRSGWCTPAAVLPPDMRFSQPVGPLRDCAIDTSP
jgi:short subunit dehydrogenase-like uncharacterized protein